MPRINLLPWRDQQRTDRKTAFMVGLGAALLSAGALTGLAWLLFDQMIDSQQARNTLLRSEIKVLDKQIEEINGLEQQKQQNIARMQIIDKLQQSRPEIVHIFDTFNKTIPDGVFLTSIDQTERNFKLTGIAQSWNRVSEFMRSIDGSEWLKEAEVTVVESKTAGQEFILTAKQRASAAEEAQAAKPKPKDNRKKS